MKTLKKLSLGLLAAAVLTGNASASYITLHIVGSTAFRSPATAAMVDYLSNGGANTVHAVFQGSSLLGSSAALLANGTIDGVNSTNAGGTATVVIETYWTGSLAGVVDIAAGNNTGKYMDPTSIGGTTGAGNVATFNATTVTTSPYGGGTAITPAGTQTSAPDAAFSDSINTTINKELASQYISASAINGQSLATIISTITGLVNAGSGSTATDGLVGVVPFEWILGSMSSAGTAVITANGNSVPTNITQNAARSLITTGYIAQSFLTGSNTAADTANYFYPIGRNEDSGTRIGAFMESQFGVTAAPSQYIPNSSGTTLTSLGLWPTNTSLNTEPAIKWTHAGHSGFTSGGGVQGACNLREDGTNLGTAAGNSGGDFLIGYVGWTDGYTAVNSPSNSGIPATILTYNGFAPTQANVENGSYTFWTFEHLYILPSGSTIGNGALSGTALTAINTIANNIHDTDADVAGNGTHAAVTGSTNAGGILFGNMNVTRSTTEGGSLTHQ